MLIHPHTSLTFEQCQKARMARDSRFDGRFYIAVKTTGIFCRPICPANLPKEENVEYFTDKTQALKAGYRPCLRCRPDSAPGSWAWKGVETTLIVLGSRIVTCACCSSNIWGCHLSNMRSISN